MMFNKLSFDELAKFYGAIAELEKAYGKEKVMAGLKAMAEVLDGETKKPSPATIQQQEENTEQLELIPLEDRELKKKTKPKTIRKRGELERIAREKASELYPELSFEQALVRMYYVENRTQQEIGEMLGVSQREISRFLSLIPEKRKRKLIAVMTK